MGEAALDGTQAGCLPAALTGGGVQPGNISGTKANKWQPFHTERGDDQFTGFSRRKQVALIINSDRSKFGATPPDAIVQWVDNEVRDLYAENEDLDLRRENDGLLVDSLASAYKSMMKKRGTGQAQLKTPR